MQRDAARARLEHLSLRRGAISLSDKKIEGGREGACTYWTYETDKIED